MLKSLKFRIILSSAICVIVVGVFSNVFLYRFLSNIIAEKSDNINRLNLQTVQSRLDTALEEISVLSALCSYDLQIARGMRNTQMKTTPEKRSVLNAQAALQKFLSAQTNIAPYVTRLIIFNQHGVRAQAVASVLNTSEDAARVMESGFFRGFAQSENTQMMTIVPSIIDGTPAIACLSRIYELPSSEQRGWFYIEVSPAIIANALAVYTPGSLFVRYGENGVFPSDFEGPAHTGDEDTLTIDGQVYRFQSAPLKYADLTLNSRTDITCLSSDTHTIWFTTIVVCLTSLTAALVLAVLLGNIITKPLNRLTKRLHRISENDFSRDEAIESGGGEIAEMGRVVNKMAESIETLLHETEEMLVKQKNSEIALLQSQVNPHFLYNTLDTIRWMAVIQKNPGIEKTVRSLSNLLKNLAKGVEDKILLEEELSLLRDYIDTQSVRFMEMLEFEEHVPERLRQCRIVKFTLQPLVENAIFHGIEPSGEFGRISVSAKEDAGYILIFVEDNGVGMTTETLAAIEKASPHSGGMSGIGVANVDERLKLIYGEECGLRYESEPGKYTRVTVRIKKEETPDVPRTAG